MKTLVLIRHAKSDWNNEGLQDIYRPLNNRGNTDAPVMANRVLALGLNPDYIITSPALRAYSTALVFADVFSYNHQKLVLAPDLYDTGPKEYLQRIRSTPKEVNTLFLFGHNSAITDLANELGQLRTDNIPTCGTISFEFNIGRWEELVSGRGEMKFYEFPKKGK